MSRNTTPSRASLPQTTAWPLELEVELRASDRYEVTARRLRSLTALLNGSEGVSLAVAEAHGGTGVVRVYLTVEARDMYAAHERACALVLDAVAAAGLGPAIMVAARPGGRRHATGRRMG